MGTRPHGVDDAVDQVKRMTAFLREHPEWQHEFVRPEHLPGHHQFRRTAGERTSVSPTSS
ncbi:MAG: hypothetical protein JO242_11755 [Streptosporangiaceae bacterium]|nr:hypothetical protein [Streptosporangiaceae bacterium]